MSSQKTRTAVVGVGYLGRFHAQKHKGLATADLVGVCDTSKERADALAAELSTKAFYKPEDLLGKVDAVTIASSTPTHYELSKLFLSNGVHVLVEKPMTASSREGEELCKIAEQKKLVFQVGHSERFNPALVQAQSHLKKPLFIEVHRLAPFKPRSVDVNVVLDLMIHDLDVVLSLVKSEPVMIHAVGTPVLTKTIDLANARIEFANGAVANITASRVSQRGARKFRVFQGDQYLSIDFGTGEINLMTKTGEWKDDHIPLEAEAWNLEKGDALLEETKSFIDAIQNKKNPVVSGRDGLLALRLAEDVMVKIDQHLANRRAKEGNL